MGLSELRPGIDRPCFIYCGQLYAFCIAWADRRLSRQRSRQRWAETQRYYSQLTRFSAAFAFIADISMLVLGGSLKRKERLSARLGDILSMLYLCSAVLKRFKDDGRPAADAPLLHWSMQDALFRMQEAFDGLLDNFPVRSTVRGLLRFLIFPLGKPFSPPSDDIAHKVAALMLTPGEARDRLTAGIYMPASPDEPLNILEQALQCVMVSEAVENKLRAAVKTGPDTRPG